MPPVSSYPPVLDADRVGTYPALAKAGGGFVWDAVLEYRVWVCGAPSASDTAAREDYFHAFSSYERALTFANATAGAEAPLALILQREFIDEPQPGCYVHVKEERLAEWPVEFLTRPRRTAQTIPRFLAPDAPANRLDVLRGLC